VELFKSSEKVKKKDDIKIEKDFINDWHLQLRRKGLRTNTTDVGINSFRASSMFFSSENVSFFKQFLSFWEKKM
jgi:hypothetical protein